MRNFILRILLCWVIFFTYEYYTYKFLPILSSVVHSALSWQFVLEILIVVLLTDILGKTFRIND
jgi:hypothetical protein